MTTCRDIVTLAMQMSAIVGLGRTPKAKEAEIGLDVLQSLYEQMVSDDLFGPTTRLYKTEDYTAKEYENIFADNATITIPQTLKDLETGETRVPKDLAIICVEANGVRQAYVYSGNAWETVYGLTLSSTAPLATRNKLGLASLLAFYLVDAFGGQIGVATTRNAMKFKADVAGTYRSQLAEREFF